MLDLIDHPFSRLNLIARSPLVLPYIVLTHYLMIIRAVGEISTNYW